MGEDNENTINVGTMTEILKQKGVEVVTDVKRLSTALDNLSQSVIRRHVNNGQLRAVKHLNNMIVLQRQDVAEWLVKFPEYLIPKRPQMQEVTQEDYDNWSSMIRSYLHGSWRSLLQYMDADDIVSEVIIKIASRRREMKSIPTVVFRALNDIAKKKKRRPSIVSVDNIEKVASQEEDSND